MVAPEPAELQIRETINGREDVTGELTHRQTIIDGSSYPSRCCLPSAHLTADVSSSEAIGKRTAAGSCTLNVASRVAISSPYVNPNVHPRRGLSSRRCDRRALGG